MWSREQTFPTHSSIENCWLSQQLLGFGQSLIGHGGANKSSCMTLGEPVDLDMPHFTNLQKVPETWYSTELGMHELPPINSLQAWGSRSRDIWWPPRPWAGSCGQGAVGREAAGSHSPDGRSWLGVCQAVALLSAGWSGRPCQHQLLVQRMQCSQSLKQNPEERGAGAKFVSGWMSFISGQKTGGLDVPLGVNDSGVGRALVFSTSSVRG